MSGVKLNEEEEEDNEEEGGWKWWVVARRDVHAAGERLTRAREHGDRAAGVQLDIRIIMAGANHVLDTDTSTNIVIKGTDMAYLDSFEILGRRARILTLLVPLLMRVFRIYVMSRPATGARVTKAARSRQKSGQRSGCKVSRPPRKLRSCDTCLAV